MTERDVSLSRPLVGSEIDHLSACKQDQRTIEEEKARVRDEFDGDTRALQTAQERAHDRAHPLLAARNTARELISKTRVSAAQQAQLLQNFVTALHSIDVALARQAH